MLSRGFHDALALWPVAVWAIVISSAFWAFLRLCGFGAGPSGASLIATSRWAETTAWVFVPAAALFEAAMHLYLLWAIGWFYAFVALPVFIFGWTILPAVLDDFAPGLALLVALHVVMAAALAVLLGFVEIGPLRALNAEVYSLADRRARLSVAGQSRDAAGSRPLRGARGCPSDPSSVRVVKPGRCWPWSSPPVA